MPCAPFIRILFVRPPFPPPFPPGSVRHREFLRLSSTYKEKPFNPRLISGKCFAHAPWWSFFHFENLQLSGLVSALGHA
jgi:hypothetical protein